MSEQPVGKLDIQEVLADFSDEEIAPETSLKFQDELAITFKPTEFPEPVDDWGDYTLLTKPIVGFKKTLLLSRPTTSEGFARYIRILADDLTEVNQKERVRQVLERHYADSPLLNSEWRASIESAQSKGSELIKRFLVETGSELSLDTILGETQLNLRSGIDANRQAIASTNKRLMDFSVDSARNPEVWEHEELHLLQHESDEKHEFVTTVHKSMIQAGHNVQQEMGGLGGAKRLEAGSKGDVAKACIEGLTEWARWKLHKRYNFEFSELPRNPYAQHIIQTEMFFQEIMKRAAAVGQDPQALEMRILQKVIPGKLPELFIEIAAYKNSDGKDPALELGEMFLELGVKW